MASIGTSGRRGCAARPSDRAPRTLTAFLLVVSPALLTAGCGYSLSARTNPHITSIAIPIFENKTLEKGIEERLAEGLTDAFLADKKLRVVKEKDADSVILGTIERYDRTPFSYDKDQNVQEYRVDMQLRVVYEDRKKNRMVWEEEAMHAWGTYSVSAALPGGVEEERAAQDRAIKKAADDILIKTVQGW
jgi:outer membrane lipopolysaccharide assembly protein LptE/RlpB